MHRSLTGKRAVLTGASGGIGQALAKALAKAGVRLVLAGRDAEKLNALANQLNSTGAEAIAIPTDITHADQRTRLVEETVRAFGGIDLLINNAGIGSWGHFADSSEAICREVMEVNFFSPIELTRTAMPHLMNGHQPAIVNITSMCGRKGMPAWPEYSASKFALVGMTEAWRGEFARFDVDVITIVPGMTNSGFQNNWLRNDGKAELRFDQAMAPEYLADRIVAAIESNRTEMVCGAEARRLLRFNRFFPRLTNWLIARKVKKLYSK